MAHVRDHDTEWEGPRERLLRFGPEALGEAELLAVVLGTGSEGEPVLALADALLREAGGLRHLVRLGAGALARRPGIGAGKAARLLAGVELGRRALAPPASHLGRVSSSADVDRMFRPRLSHAEVEHFVVLALDARNRVLRELLLAKGGVSACPVAPAEVFRALLREAAVSAVLVHNHPSGDPTPSADDVALTQRLIEAGELVGVRVHDHVIVAKDGYQSLLDLGLVGT